MTANRSITLCENGPMVVGCEAEINGATVKAGAALCRCGQSQNKPYCDGSHKGAGFVDPGNVGIRSQAPETPGGSIAIKSITNGPLVCTGPFTIHAANGASAHTASRASLCRCGQSAKKPYCDGTHSQVGFDAD